jgi:glutaredoxin 3
MNVKIYTTSKCKWCKTTKGYFEEKGIEYTECDIEFNNLKAEEMAEKSGQRSVPVIDINGTIIVGFDKDAIDECIKSK